MKPHRTIAIAFLFLLLGAAPEKSGQTVLILSSNEPHVQAVAQGFRAAFSGDYREINLEGSDKKIRAFGEELQAAKPHLAVAVGDHAAQLAKWYLAGVPVIYCDAPRASKIALPESQSIGVSHFSRPSEQLEVIRKLFPNRKRIGLFYSREYSGILNGEKLAAEARGQGLELRLNIMGSIQEVPGRLREEMPRADLLWVFTDPVVFSSYSIEYLVLQSVTAGVPIFCGDGVLAAGGATAAWVPDLADVGAKAAQEAKRVLEKAPVSYGSVLYPQGSLVLNNRIATLLKISFSADDLSRAVKVIQ